MTTQGCRLEVITSHKNRLISFASRQKALFFSDGTFPPQREEVGGA